MKAQVTPDQANHFAIAYTDGCCIPNPGPGGLAFTISMPDSSTVEYQRHDPSATNNTAEMDALEACLRYLLPEQKAVIYADSSLCADGFNKWLPRWIAKDWRGSKNKPVKNADIWKRIAALKDQRPNVRVEWVKGHNGTSGNERADALAKEAAGNWGLASGKLTINGVTQ
ncbi:ribonuclease H family protein [Pseudaestuariivita sp.]|uniref:ribonuclease H family protein n=1 Tax=Pseudaestuariivita sp. TaxID=2211669 RepID=UPI004058260C